MKIEGSYIQYAAGFDKDEITDKDIDKAIKDLILMEDEHGGFWVGVYGADTEEMVLELHKSLVLFGNFGDENYKIQLETVEVAKVYFRLLLNGSIGELKEKLRNN
jgi:hypothetical protein